MADEKPHELLIIKRYRGGHDGHHGGAWKIAFADFMTAMMALFLVLWLISATSEKTKVSIARYFNPVKLVDMSTMKKGVSDPNDNIATNPDPQADGHSRKSESGAQRDEQSDAPAKDDKQDSDGPATYHATHSEASLFRDPYAVLAEIIANGGAQSSSRKTTTDGEKLGVAENTTDSPEPFRDPFKLVVPDVFSNVPGEQQQPPAARAPSPERSAQPAAKAAASSVPAPAPAPIQAPSPPPLATPSRSVAALGTPAASDKPPPADASAPQPPAGKAPISAAPTRGDADAVARNDLLQKPGSLSEEAGKLQTEIAAELAKVVGKTGSDKAVPNLEIKASEEGILISLTDQYNYAMFAIGSAEPQARTIQVMGKIAEILKKYPGPIVIRGHTDARPYKGANYDNWRLSSARAHMAQYMLIRGGLDEKRIDKIEGYADHKLKNPKDSLAAENRRIEILLRKDRT